MIDEKELVEQVKSLRVTITGLRAGKSILNEYAQHFKDSVIKIIDEQQRVGEWIPVEERLPESCEYVLVSCVNGAVEYGAYYAGDKDWSLISTDWQCKVLAWQPLPKPYEVKENE